MTRHFGKSIALVGAIAALGTAAHAQEGDDWYVLSDAAKKTTSAGVAYSSNVVLRVQCVAGELDVGIAGLHTRPQVGNRYERALANGQTAPSFWIVSDDGTTLLARDAARVARSFKAGGSLTLSAPSDSANPLQVRLELPTQSAGIDRVLTDCGRALSDPRDSLLSAMDQVIELPRLQPSSTANRYRQIDIELSCLIAAGRLEECQSDHQNPVDAQVGLDTARRANGTAIQLRDPAAAEGRVLTVTLTGSSRRQ